MASELRVGVVADTHGLLRPEAVRALEGCQVILHAGDIGGSQVLDELQRLAPVLAVRGNCDGGWARLLPERRRLDLGGATVLLLHDQALLGPEPFGPAEQRDGDRVVVFGHSHQPVARRAHGVLSFNPGSAGPRRFSLPVTVGTLDIRDGRVRPRLVDLLCGRPREDDPR